MLNILTKIFPNLHSNFFLFLNETEAKTKVSQIQEKASQVLKAGNIAQYNVLVQKMMVVIENCPIKNNAYLIAQYMQCVMVTDYFGNCFLNYMEIFFIPPSPPPPQKKKLKKCLTFF